VASRNDGLMKRCGCSSAVDEVPASVAFHFPAMTERERARIRAPRDPMRGPSGKACSESLAGLPAGTPALEVPMSRKANRSIKRESPMRNKRKRYSPGAEKLSKAALGPHLDLLADLREDDDVIRAIDLVFSREHSGEDVNDHSLGDTLDDNYNRITMALRDAALIAGIQIRRVLAGRSDEVRARLGAHLRS